MLDRYRAPTSEQKRRALYKKTLDKIIYSSYNIKAVDSVIHFMRIWRNWQTRMVQVHVKAISCRFNSCYPHQKKRRRNFSCFGAVFFLRYLSHIIHRRDMPLWIICHIILFYRPDILLYRFFYRRVEGFIMGRCV